LPDPHDDVMANAAMAGMINFENDMIGFLGMKYWC
jgi:hypothetical protein